MTERFRRSRKTREIALCGVLAALAVSVMLLGGLIPLATFCCPVLASLVLIPAHDLCDPPSSVGLYAVIGTLSLLIAPDKESAFLFVFLGYYPVLRPVLGRIRPRVLRVFAKLAVFNLATFAMYALLLSVFRFGTLTAEFASYSRVMLSVLLGLGNLTFLIFDLALGRLTVLYRRRLRPQLVKLFHLI